MNIDNSDSFDICQVLAPVSKVSNATDFYSSPCSMVGYNSATAVIGLGAATSDTLSGALYWTFKLQESDTYNSGFTDVAAGEITNLAANSVVVDANGKLATAYKIGYKGDAKYIRVACVVTGNHVYGNLMDMYIVLGNKRMGGGSDTAIAVATA
jgi:hypothetical protein